MSDRLDRIENILNGLAEKLDRTEAIANSNARAIEATNSALDAKFNQIADAVIRSQDRLERLERRDRDAIRQRYAAYALKPDAS